MKQSLKNRVRKSALKLHKRFGIHPRAFNGGNELQFLHVKEQRKIINRVVGQYYSLKAACLRQQNGNISQLV